MAHRSLLGLFAFLAACANDDGTGSPSPCAEVPCSEDRSCISSDGHAACRCARDRHGDRLACVADAAVPMDGASARDAATRGDGGSEPNCRSRPVPRRGVSARWRYEDAYDNADEGAWYRDADNERALLAWGESYVMMSLAAMFRATGSPEYLARLIWHADGVLAQRDDRRGVTDYRGISAACWRDLHYQPHDEPYCYVVHSGMIAYPMVELARLVRAAGLEDEHAYDGQTFGEKAEAYVTAAEQTVAAHDDQFNPAGYYVFRPDASFLTYAGRDVPFNQSNAMGRLLLALYDVTGNRDYLDRATALARRLREQMSTGPEGEYLWNYWGGSYSPPGEDISHASINVAFAVQAASRGVVFSTTDLQALATTFLTHVYVNDRTFSDHVGGGSTNDPSVRSATALWLGLAPLSTSVYTAARDLYERDYLPDTIGSASNLLGWALLAEHEPIHRQPFFYPADWSDLDTSTEGDWRQATAFGANILTVPRRLDEPALVPLEVQVPRPTKVQQWDGSAYHTVARWQPTEGPLLRYIPYEPQWPFVYWREGVLYQFADAFVAGDGIQVREPPAVELPTITSSAPSEGIAGEAWRYEPAGAGQAPDWWALAAAPSGARIDHASGALEWTPPGPGSYCFTLVHQNDWGDTEQHFIVRVP